MDYKSCSRVSIAPMMDWTDRHCRYFMRLLSPNVRLYTEMVTAAAIYHGDKRALLRFDASEHPIAIQLGGSDPAMMASAARDAESAGYDEININVGCPSDRVQSGQFGACLMATPDRVAECLAAMQEAVDVPVTIKTRIGIDDNDDYDYLHRFVEITSAAGCKRYIVHARTAILEGLSPKENRSVPPLRYEHVFRLKDEFPGLHVALNGGVKHADQVADLLDRLDGVMIGRQAYNEPYMLAELEQRFLGGGKPPARRQIVEQMYPYIEQELGDGERLIRIARHMLGLFAGQPGARAWRRIVSENAHRRDAGIEVLTNALNAIPEAA